MNYVLSKHAFCKIGEFQTWKWGGCVTKKKIILTFSDISDTNEKIIFMYAGLQLTSFRCSWGFWKYIRCLMPKYNIKGNFSFQMWSYYIAWWPYMNSYKPLKNSYKNGSQIMHYYTVLTKALKYWRQCLNKVQCMRNVYFAYKICVNSIRRF